MSLKKILVGTLITTLLVGSGIVAKADTNLDNAIKEKAFPITSVGGNDYNDLVGLNDILKDKRIIGLGESSHGGKEVFQFKVKFVKYMVEELGCRAFVIEDTIGASKLVNDYVVRGQGTSEEVMKNLFNIWNTKELQELLDWMKEYNTGKEPKDQVRFYGMDVQDLRTLVKTSCNYISRVDSENKDKAMEFEDSIPEENGDKKAEEAYGFLSNLISSNKETYISKSSEAEYEFIKYIVNQINVTLEYAKKPEVNKRDKLMAENTKWISYYEEKYYDNKLMALWAHNGHITKHMQYKPTGGNLEEIYGDKYYAVGFDFYKGSFSAADDMNGGKRSEFIIQKSGEDHFSSVIEPSSINNIFFDINTAKENNELKKIFEDKLKMYVFGASSSKFTGMLSGVYKYDLDKDFDAIVYLEESSPATSLVWNNAEYPKIDVLNIGSYLKVIPVVMIGLVVAVSLIIIVIKVSKKRKNK